MRKEFQMTQKQQDDLLKAMQPVPYMVIGGIEPRSQQQNANDAWDRLGKEMGFVGSTVQGAPGKSSLFFTAEVVSGAR